MCVCVKEKLLEKKKPYEIVVGKTVVITGVSGIAEAAASALLDLGADVVLAGRKPMKGQEVANAFNKRNSGKQGSCHILCLLRTISNFLLATLVLIFASPLFKLFLRRPLLFLTVGYVGSLASRDGAMSFPPAGSFITSKYSTLCF